MDLLCYHRAVEHRGVRPVDLHHIPRRVPQVHLNRPVRYLVETREVALLLPNVHLPRLLVGRLEVVDVYAEVVAPGRCLVALKEMQLQVAEAQPAYGEREVWCRDLLHTEELLVETHRLIEVVGMDACVGKTRGFHRASSRSLCSGFSSRHAHTASSYPRPRRARRAAARQLATCPRTASADRRRAYGPRPVCRARVARVPMHLARRPCRRPLPGPLRQASRRPPRPWHSRRRRGGAR